MAVISQHRVEVLLSIYYELTAITYINILMKERNIILNLSHEATRT